MIDITKFCRQDATRKNIATPWSHNGKTYATDGRIAIALDGEDPRYPYRNDAPKPEHIFSVRDMALRYEPFDFDQETDIKMVRCPDCKGTGKQYEECPDCLGSGEVTCPACNYDHPCDNCNETGRVPVEGDAVCSTCSGAKEIVDCKPVYTHSGIFDMQLLWRLKDLPGVVFAVPKTFAPDRAWHCKFDGGEGVVMPRSRCDAAPYERCRALHEAAIADEGDGHE